MDKEPLISIKQEHIEQGRKNSPGGCPMALAVRESLGLEPFQVGVGYSRIVWKSQGDYYSAELPDEILYWPYSFDQGIEVKPVSFRIKPKNSEKCWEMIQP